MAQPFCLTGLLARSPVVARAPRYPQPGALGGFCSSRGGGPHGHRREQLGHGTSAVARRRAGGGVAHLHPRRATPADKLEGAARHREGVRGRWRASARKDSPDRDGQHGGERRCQQTLIEGGGHAGAGPASDEAGREAWVHAESDPYPRQQAGPARPDVPGRRNRGITVPPPGRRVRSPEWALRAVHELHRRGAGAGTPRAHSGPGRRNEAHVGPPHVLYRGVRP